MKTKFFNKNLILYSWVIASLLSINFITKLTPKLLYFVSRTAADIAADFIFILSIWAAIFFICLLVEAIVKERFRIIVFWAIGVLAAALSAGSSKYFKALFGIDKKEESAGLLPSGVNDAVNWIQSHIFAPIPDALRPAIESFLAIAAITGFILLSYWMAKKYQRTVLVFLATMFLFLTFNLAYYRNDRFANKTIDNSTADLPIKSLAVNRGNIPLPQTAHIIIFDSFPYEQEIFAKNSAEATKYKNFQGILSQSYAYHNARSVADKTEESILGMIAGRTGPFQFDNNKVYARVESDGRRELNSLPNIFSLARENGDAAYATGYFHEYCYVFKKYLNDCSDYSFYSTFDSIFRMGAWNKLSLRWRVFRSNLAASSRRSLNMSLPLLYDGGEFMSPRLWAALLKSIVFDYQDFMAKNTKTALFFTHLNIPHVPIVFNAKGEMNKSGSNNPSSYKEELQYMDYILGVLLEDIKKTSDYDKSLIIITADHSFRDEEVQGLEVRNVMHVPFVIKAPMQKERQDIDAEFSALNLMEILKNYYSARASGQYERLLHI